MVEIEEDQAATRPEIQSLVTQIHGRMQNMDRKINSLMERENSTKGEDETKALSSETAAVKRDKENADKIRNELTFLLEQPDKMENNLEVRTMIDYVKQWLMSDSMMEFAEPCKWNHERFEKDDRETKRLADLVTGCSSNDDLEREGPVDGDDTLINIEELEAEMRRKLWCSKEAEGIRSDAKGEEQDLSASTGTMGSKDDEIKEGSKADADVQHRAIESMVSSSSKDVEQKDFTKDGGILTQVEELTEEIQRFIRECMEVKSRQSRIIERLQDLIASIRTRDGEEGETEDEEKSKDEEESWLDELD